MSGAGKETRHPLPPPNSEKKKESADASDVKRESRR